MEIKNDDFISIIIPTCNRHQDLIQILSLLCKYKYDGITNYEIIVVDNNSKDRTKEIIESFIKENARIRYIYEPNQGVSYARNRGIREAIGKLIVFIDDDVIPDNKWLIYIYECFINYKCDAIGGRILPLYPENIPQWVKDNKDILSGPIVNYDLGDDIKSYKNRNFAAFVGANMAFRKYCFEKCGYFNTNIGAGKSLWSEDSEFFKRMEQSGLNLYYCGNAVVWHPVDISRTKFTYLKEWYFRAGRYLAFEDFDALIAKKYKFYFGVPRYLYRQIICYFFQLIFCFNNKNKFLEAWTRLFMSAGQCFQFRLMKSAKS